MDVDNGDAVIFLSIIDIWGVRRKERERES
jgi:hypothetical protein